MTPVKLSTIRGKRIQYGEGAEEEVGSPAVPERKRPRALPSSGEPPSVILSGISEGLGHMYTVSVKLPNSANQYVDWR